MRHDLTTVLRWVEAGEEVTVLKRNKPVARLCPALPETPPEEFRAPDFGRRIGRIFGDRKVSNAVLAEREGGRW